MLGADCRPTCAEDVAPTKHVVGVCLQASVIVVLLVVPAMARRDYHISAPASMHISPVRPNLSCVHPPDSYACTLRILKVTCSTLAEGHARDPQQEVVCISSPPAPFSSMIYSGHTGDDKGERTCTACPCRGAPFCSLGSRTAAAAAEPSPVCAQRHRRPSSG